MTWAVLTLPSPFSTATADGRNGLSIVHDCANPIVGVKALSPVDFDEICRGADDAIAFFGRLSLKPAGRLVVEIVPHIPRVVGESAVGCYLEDEQRILVIDFPGFARNKTWFNVPIDRSMYRSLVTHEVAHAVADCNMSIPEPTIQAKEYLAYVAMFATMNQGLREEIMNATPAKAFDRESKINPTIYLCDPMRFAIRAYRHYLQEGYGDKFLYRVLSGKALAEQCQ